MMRRPDELYIFSTSSRPDPYVNIVVHTTKVFPIKKIFFISIIEHNYSTEQGEETARAVAAATDSLLESLAAGKYRRNDKVDESIQPEEAAVYEKCIEHLRLVQISSMGIQWSDLADKLKEFSSNDAIFDVSTLKKNLLVDVVALLLSQDKSQLWTFELIKTPTYGVEDLVHAMTEGSDYMYRCITDSRHVETASKRMLSRSLTYRSLLLITGLLFVPVGIVEIFFPQSLPQSLIVSMASTVTISTWFLVMKRG